MVLGAGGTVINVAPGANYGGLTLNKSGTATARIVWQGAVNHTSKVANATWQFNGSFIDVNGWYFTNPGSSGYALNLNPGHDEHIINNYMHDFTTSACGSYGVINETPRNPQSLPNPSHDNWFISNVIRHAGNYGFGTNNCVTLHGIYQTGANDRIQNNVISGITGWGIKMNGYPGTIVVTNNTIFNNGGGISPTEANDTGQSVIFDFNTISNNVIVNNGTDAPNGGRFGINYYHVTGTHNLVTNNLIYGNLPTDYAHHDAACDISPISGNDAPPPSNSQTHQGTGPIGGGCPSANVKTDANTTATFVNFVADTNSAPTGSYNVQNYILKSTSNGVDKGSTLCAASPGQNPCVPPSDFNGVARPQGPAFDIGSFEQ